MAEIGYDFPYQTAISVPETGNVTEPWSLFFQNLAGGSSSGDSSGFSDVETSSVTGTNFVVDSVDIDGAAGAVFYFYRVHDGTNSKTGIIFTLWEDDGTIPTSFFQADAEDIGTATTIRFNFNYSSPDVQLRATVTAGTYTFYAKRLTI